MSIGMLSNQTASVRNPGNIDKHGKAGLGTAFDVRGRFEKTSQVIATAQREREPLHALFAVGPQYSIQTNAQVSYQGTLYRVMGIKDSPGADGSIHHYILQLQDWSYA